MAHPHSMDSCHDASVSTIDTTTREHLDLLYSASEVGDIDSSPPSLRHTHPTWESIVGHSFRQQRPIIITFLPQRSFQHHHLCPHRQITHPLSNAAPVWAASSEVEHRQVITRHHQHPSNRRIVFQLGISHGSYAAEFLRLAGFSFLDNEAREPFFRQDTNCRCL